MFIDFVVVVCVDLLLLSTGLPSMPTELEIKPGSGVVRDRPCVHITWDETVSMFL